MSWIAAAVVGSAAIGAFGASKASKTAAKGQERASDTLTQAASRARQEIIPRFDKARIAQRQGFGGALSVLRQTEERVGKPFRQGSALAQQQVIRGGEQAQRALLGQQTDLSGFQTRDLPPIQQLRVPNAAIQSAAPPAPAAQPDIQEIIRRAIAAGNFAGGGL